MANLRDERPVSARRSINSPEILHFMSGRTVPLEFLGPLLSLEPRSVIRQLLLLLEKHQSCFRPEEGLKARTVVNKYVAIQSFTPKKKNKLDNRTRRILPGGKGYGSESRRAQEFCS